MGGVCAGFGGPQPPDTVAAPARELRDVTVTAIAPRRLLKQASDGQVIIDGRVISEQISFLGGGDPLAVVRSMPAVATANDLQAAHSVRGGATGDNLFESDGARIVNPLHMLGLFSAFNPAFYRTYTFRPGCIPACLPSLTSAYFAAESGMEPDSVISGTLAAGIIESHAAVSLPLGKNMSVSAALRHTYLDALFPNLLTLGSSRLDYGFTDVNLAFRARVGSDDLLRLSFFGNADRMNIHNAKAGTKEGRLGWRNMALSAKWDHGRLAASLAYSAYANSFRLDEGGRRLDLPSFLRQITARASMPAGDFVIESDLNFRHTSGQNGFGESSAWEWNAASDYTKQLGERFMLSAGLRLAVYFNGSYFALRPQPRLGFDFSFDSRFGIYAAISRRVRFDRLVEETTAGLPADFWTAASKSLPPEDALVAELGVRGVIPHTAVHFTVEAYYRRVNNAAEFTGALLDLASPDYNPLSDLTPARGYAAGLSLSAMRQIGRVRGRIGYNFAASRLRFDSPGAAYFPSSHDRPHDLNVQVNWSAFRGFTLSAAFTHATGTPYTRAKFGYMIGENLICEYYPHNSSRLPDYNRLDMAAAYTSETGRFRHTFTLSVYNALACRNVLFRYPSYSVQDGIEQRESIMKAVIPALTYTMGF